ncbi:hypothetical protein [Streptomyces sp. BE303]|uniref:hypothetical protein n=1 Tax=Streptomyces sp. BE303 TaxID=3002528 RepID=UPI002E77429D|nr:hypothetical protein [Streptomyces sp. BE303]MED7952628.1 hypothetical protein [Streptomyces sp. BE303]
MGTAGRKVAAAAAVGVLLGTLAACGSGGKTSGHTAGSTVAASASPGSAEGAAGASGAASPAPTGTASPAPTGTAAPGTAGGTEPGGTPAADGVTAPAGTAAGATTGAGSGGASGGAPAGGAPGGASGANTAGTTAGGGAQPTAGPDSDTLLLDGKLVLQLLPDQKAMTGWEEEKRKVDTADHATTCTTTAPCTGKPLSGTARFASGEVTARFGVDTLAGRAEAANRLKEAYAAYGDAAHYTALDLGVLGTESRAFQGQLGGRDGVSIVLRSGTVVASVTTEGGPVDRAATRRLAAMLVKRIEQAQAGRTPDAVLDPA